ncbi:chromo domain-containing protein [Phanerochaete sordida]|uniref:Chromo domain-containing protein n=1 Tax=Phanerochaete sordida TaxID=48140 RepID=A0A9P3G345_9APHY|nr:chromo domain-containing protein [Phanerochaete sordida]
MSGSGDEYEVETVLRAKVVRKGSMRKTWHYLVKWKGYDDPAENTWEPYDSFEGSEHIITGFWERIGGGRDPSRMDLFEVGEEIFPVGPPGKRKPVKPVKKEAHSSPRRPAPSKRKPTDSEGEVQSLIDDEVDEVVPKPISTRKRRTSSIDQAAEAPSPKRRRGRPPVELIDTDEDEIQESVSKAPASRRQTRNTPSTSTVAGSSASGRVTRSAASPRKSAAGNQAAPQSRRAAPQRKPKEQEVIEIDTTDSEEEAAAHATSPSNLADESGDSTPVEEPVGTRTRKTNGAAKAPTRAPPAARSIPKSKSEPEPSPERAPRAVKSRSLRKLQPVPAASTSNGTKPSPTRAKISASRAGPGRSSKGIVLDVPQPALAQPALVKAGRTRKQLGTPARATPGRAARRMTPLLRDESVDSMAVDEQYLPPLTTEDLDRLASLSQPSAGPSAPAPALAPVDLDATSERDAEGEVDHDFVEDAGAVKPPSKVEAKAEMLQVEEDQVMAESQPEEEHPKEPEPVISPLPKEPLINPIDAPLSSSSARPSSSFASWRKLTIFDSIFSSASEPSAVSPSAEQSETATPILLIPIDASVRIPVLLQDINPPAEPTRKTLQEIAAVALTTPQGAPGKFYKGEPVANMLKALTCGGSSARVALQESADASAKENFERFHGRLKDGAMFVAILGSYILAFCASANSELVAKLGMSPNLAGVGENVLVSEVLIGDDSAYIDAIMLAEDEPW